MQPGISVQDGAIFTADAADLSRFGSCLLICAWTPPDAALNVLASAGVPIGAFRWTQDSRRWAGWPGDYVRRCPWAVAWNEPDQDGPAPDWYGPACDAWRAAGGRLVEPAWSDERQRTDDGRQYDAVSVHCYPAGRGAANLAAVRARAGGRPVWITEAGDQANRAAILVELAALGAGGLPTWLYCFRALNAQAVPAYNLAGVALTPPPPSKGPTMPDYPGAAWSPSPNYWPGRSGHAVTGVVLHGTAGPGAVSWFANPASAVSAHYVVGEDASVTQCVAEADSAWHAGAVTPDSEFADGPNPNYATIGLEHERNQTNDNPLPAAQLQASLTLVADLMRRHGPLDLLQHHAIAVGRVCPGPGFPIGAYAQQAAMLYPLRLDGMPVDDQLDAAQDPDANREANCGPACVWMVARWRGVLPTGATIHDVKIAELGGDGTGYTTTDQMLAWFAARGVPAVQAQPGDVAAALEAAIANGDAPVYLRWWDVPAKSGGHFLVGIAADPARRRALLLDPWGGNVRAMPYDQINSQANGNWLVTVKGAQVMDPALKAAATARFAALGVQPNTETALFAAYARMVAAWLANGQDGVLDPTPAIKPEAVLPDGSSAYLLLDSGRCLHWRKDTGQVYQCEYRELPAVLKACGWA